MIKSRKINPVKKLDYVFSQVVRLRDKRCLKCGKTEGLQCAHIIPRTVRNTRWDLENGITLCLGCHLYWAHKNPIEFVEWLQSIYQKEKLDNLKIRGQITKSNIDLKLMQIYLLNELEKYVN